MSWFIIDFIIIYLSVFFRSAAFFVGGAVIFIAIAADLIIFALSYNGVQISDIKIKGFVEEEQKAVLTVYINNSSILPFINSSFIVSAKNSLYNLKRKSTEKILIKPRTMGQKAEITIKCPKFGRMDISVYNLKINDILGIIRLKKRKRFSVKCVCTPKIMDIDYPVSSVNNSAFIQSDDYSSIRELNDNESIRNVNWKLTASKNKLLTKEFEKISKDTVLIFMEYNNKNVIRKVFSYCKKMLDEDKKCDVMYVFEGKYASYMIECFEELISFLSLISDIPVYEGEKGRGFSSRVYICWE